jgi:hypothetical protein
VPELSAHAALRPVTLRNGRSVLGCQRTAREPYCALLHKLLGPKPSSHAACGWTLSANRPLVLGRFRLHLVKHRSMLKHRIRSTLINFGRPCPVTDLFGVEGRKLLERLQVPEPWRSNYERSGHRLGLGLHDRRRDR